MRQRDRPGRPGRRSGDSGFTLVELMIVVAVSGVVATALAAFFLHHRALARAVSTDRELEQTGRLVLDQLRRDARVSGKLTTGPGSLTLEGKERRVTYRLQNSALVREAAPVQSAGLATTRDLYPRVTAFRVQPSGRALKLRLILGADLAVVQRRRQLSATVLLEARR